MHHFVGNHEYAEAICILFELSEPGGFGFGLHSVANDVVVVVAPAAAAEVGGQGRGGQHQATATKRVVRGASLYNAVSLLGLGNQC